MLQEIATEINEDADVETLYYGLKSRSLLKKDTGVAPVVLLLSCINECLLLDTILSNSL